MEEDPTVFPMESDIPEEIYDDEQQEENIEGVKKELKNKWEHLAQKEPNEIRKIHYLKKAIEVWRELADEGPE